MNLNEYFENTEGCGVLGTADAQGHVDMAIYGRPHVIDDETVAFIMADRLSHDNVTANPNAAYLFIESDPGYKGKRLYLTKTREETDPARITAMRRASRKSHEHSDARKFLVYFKIEKTRPLTGD